MPKGSCDFRDLSVGARAPTCGCKRFWLNTGHYSSDGGNTERAYCFCSHHACFHNALSQPIVPGPASIKVGRALPRTDTNAVDGSGPRRQESRLGSQASQPKGLGIRAGSSAHPQSINTRVWEALNAFARNQEDGSPAGTTSKLPSTATPSVAGDASDSPDGVPQYRSMGPPLTIPIPYQNAVGSDEYSATEVATPSVAGTPDFRAPAVGPRTYANPSLATAARDSRERQPTSDPPMPPAVQLPQLNGSGRVLLPTVPNVSLHEMRNMLQAYGRRIDVLESLSFSHVPIEEVQEKFELFDGRLLDLEQWRTEFEQRHASPEPEPENGKRRRPQATEVSFSASDGSFDSAAAAHTEAAVLATLAANAETGPRIDILETRVADLESAALPSFARPWQVQVVLLPWGREVRGIWFSALEATQQSSRSFTQASEEWVGVDPMTRLSFKSSESGAWTTESIQAWADEAQEWLSPKACGPTGTVFERLASRGLVREVTLASPDSRHVLRAMEHAFRNVLTDERAEAFAESQGYQALHERLIPLRKVRKSTRLRFLSQSEMVTSAAWTASFLDSCAMKIKDRQRRLYVTTSEAYLQPVSGGWSWQKLCQLPIYDASGEEQAAQATNAAIEACWTYNERLDRRISTHSSFASHASRWSTRSQQPADQPEGCQQEAPPSPHSEARPGHYRAISLPDSSSVIDPVRATIPKRRVASFETSTTGPIPGGSIDTSAAGKRRRISTSPEAERRGVGFTPRWSREPPSPFTSEHAGEARSQGTSSRKRGTTPFAYATPHSHSHHAGFMHLPGGDGDTEADSDIAAVQIDRMEDEWHGMEDGDVLETQRADGGSAVDGHETDEDEQDDDLAMDET